MLVDEKYHHLFFIILVLMLPIYAITLLIYECMQINFICFFLLLLHSTFVYISTPLHLTIKKGAILTVAPPPLTLYNHLTKYLCSLIFRFLFYRRML